MIGKLIKYIITLAIVIYLAALGFVLYFARAKNLPKHADAAIVLGAKVNLNETPSDPLLDRATEAAQLYNQGLVTYVITTGGVGLGNEPESESARGILAADGVPLKDIFIETDSHTTMENIQDIVPIAQQHDIHSVIVVSDRFHVARGALVAKYFGFDPVYWAYPDASSYTLQQLALNYAREAAAVPVYLWDMRQNFSILFKSST